MQRGLKQVSEGWLWRHDEKLQGQSLYRMSPQHAQSIRENIECPHLVVLGKNGFPYLRQELEGEKSCVEITTVEGGHHCHLESSSRVSSLILLWLTEFKLVAEPFVPYLCGCVVIRAD